MKDVNYKMWTLCMVQDEDRVLMLNRTHDNFKGYLSEEECPTFSKMGHSKFMWFGEMERKKYI